MRLGAQADGRAPARHPCPGGAGLASGPSAHGAAHPRSVIAGALGGELGRRRTRPRRGGSRDPRPSGSLMKILARWCFRHRKIVLTLWLVALVGVFAIDRAAGNAFSTKFQLPNTQSFAALNLLEKEFPAVSGSSDEIVLHATSGTVRDAPVMTRAQGMLQEVATLPHVRSVASPFTTAGAAQISRDGTVAFATVTFDEQTQSLPKAAVEKVITTAQAAGDRQVQVALGGQDIEQTEYHPGSKSTLLGVVVA